MNRINFKKPLNLGVIASLSIAALIVFVTFFDPLWKISVAFILVYVLLKFFDRWHNPPNGNTLISDNSTQ